MPSHTKKIIPVLALLLLTGFTTATSHVEMQVVQNGTGFVGGQLVDDSDGLDRTDPVKVSIETNSSYDISQIQASDFNFGEGLSNPEIVDRDVNSEHNVTLTLTPSIDSYISEEVSVTFDKSSFANASVTKSFNPLIYEWSATKVGDTNPGRDLTYEQVEDGEYTFYFDVDHKGSSTLPESPLDDENFRLTVKALNRGSNGFSELVPVSELDGVSEDIEKKTWMKQSQPSGDSNYNYKVSLDNMNKLDKLPPGKYQFQLEVGYQSDYESLSPVYFTVDKTRIDKSAEFSGAIRDSTGSGVRTEMLLEGNKNTRINTGSDGIFSTTIEQNVFDSINARFFDRGLESPDSKVVLDSPEISKDSDLGLGSAAIRYQYWNNPENRIPGLESVNMMATKFAYPIDGVDSLSMAFDSGEVNLEKIQVYKCSFWNFDGVECMENWEKVDDSNINVNFAALNTNIDGVEPYTTPEGEDILMHAFIVGKRADLQLQESITVDSTELTYNSEIGVSGVLVDESGQRVENADVTLSLKDTDQIWNTTTDSTGTFQFDNKVKAEPGNYVLELEARKSPYNSLSITSDATISISYEKGIETEAPADQTITQGEDTSVQFEVTNTGQTPVDGLEVRPTGLKDQFIKSVDAPESIESGATEKVTINLALPEDYCSDTCYPELTAEVEGTAGEETVTASALLTTTLQVQDQQSQKSGSQDNEENNQQSSNTTDQQDTGTSPEEPSNESNGITGAFTEAQKMTGNFIEQQSDLNIALGLIMIFTMILAAAVKKKQGQGGGRGDRMDDRSRPNIAGGSTGSANSRVQRPDVSSKTSPEPENEADEGGEEPSEQVEEESEPVEEESEATEEEGDEEPEESEDIPDNVCDVCGEEFENATGVKIHKQAMH